MDSTLGHPIARRHLLQGGAALAAAVLVAGPGSASAASFQDASPAAEDGGAVFVGTNHNY